MTSAERWAHLVAEHTVTGVDGTPLHVIEAGSGPAVLLVHGFPELGYSWRRQLPALVQSGYRVIVPDQRGYGQSGCPDDVNAYDIEHLVGDLAAILDHLDEPTAHFVGHDWGASVVWQSSLMIPERVNSVAALSVPFTPRPNHRPTDIWHRRFGDKFFYILYFQEPGVADADLDRDPELTMRNVLTGMSTGSALGPGKSDASGFVDRYIAPETLPEWLNESELAVYVNAFTSTGFSGAINWYRNFDRNWERTPHLAGATVSVPSLFIGGSADPVLGITKLDAHLALLEDHRGNVMIDGGGHWIQQERPDEVNAALLDFLESLPQATVTIADGSRLS